MLGFKFKITILIVLFLLLIFSVLLSLRLGILEISFVDIIKILLNNIGIGDFMQEAQESRIILNEIRIPRILGAIVVGGCLALSGLIFQGVFTNPLVSPGILGVLQGASFGAALGLLMRLNYIGVSIQALFFGILATCFAIFISFVIARNSGILMLILGGIISSSIFGSGVGIIKYLADSEEVLPNIVFWLLGSLSHIDKNGLFFAFVVFIFGIVISFILSKRLDILSLGEEEAKALGVNVKISRIIFILIATLLAAVSVSLAGIIGWIGLVVPHIARFIMGVKNIYLVPFCALFGANLLLLVDNINRHFFKVEVPLGILMSFVGVPIFIAVLLGARKNL